VADGLRDLGNERAEMFQVCKEELEKRSVHYALDKGNWQERASIIESNMKLLLSS
jgi:HTH-type transcriptional repressor of NAD biosynthesis genes